MGALARKHEKGVTLEADVEMVVNMAPRIDLLGQTLHAVTRVSEAIQQ